jgi:hypothetical protein
LTSLTQSRCSYINGIEILCRSNTFHLINSETIQFLPDIMPPQRLALITSVETNWDLRAFRCQQSRTEQPLEMHWPKNVPFLAEMLPNLQKLRISFKDKWHRYQDSTELEIKETFLEPIDGLVERLATTLKECYVAVPLTAAWRLAERDIARLDHLLLDEIPDAYRYPTSDDWKVWRSLPADGDDLTCLERHTEKGYWIIAGVGLHESWWSFEADD